MRKFTNSLKALVCFTILLFSVTRNFAQTSVVLEEWPFTTNANDSVNVRAAGIVGTVPSLVHLYLANNTNNGSGTTAPGYSPTYGQATSAGNTGAGATLGAGYWGTAAGGPGGNGSHGIYEQFQLIPTTGNSLRVDSFIANSAFASSSSGASMMIVYSLSNFVADSTPITGYTLGPSAGQIPLVQQNGVPLPLFSLPLVSSGGVLVPQGDTLTVRVYPTCSSTSAGRYWELIDAFFKGAVIPSGGCLTQPNAIVAYIPNICAGQTGAIYSVPAVSGATSYTWTYSGTGATFSSTTDSVTIAYGSTATSGTLSVTANAGCGSSTARTSAITVNALPTNSITSTGGASALCAGSNLTLNANTGTGYTYQWLLSNAIIPSATSATYTASATGAYKVKITMSNSCTDTSAAFTITTGSLPPVPTITPSTAQSFCAGGHVVLSITKVPGNTYQWLKNSAIAGDTLATDTVYTAGSYTVKATSASTCSDTSATVVVTVNALSADTVTASGSLSLCTGGSVTLTVNNTTGATYQWLNGGNVIAGATANTYSATATGSYTVKVTGTNTCTDTSLASAVTVNAYPADTVSASGGLTFCAGGNVTLTVNTTAGAAYQWLVGGAPVAGATSSTYSATAAGTYTVKVTSNSCSDTSVAKTVTVNPLPVPVVTETGKVLSTTGTFTTYQWNFNGTALTGVTTSTLAATTNGNGSYTVTVKDGNGCAGTSAAFTVTDASGVPTVQGLASAIKLYPNPATDIVHIDAPVKVNVTIAGIDGRSLQHSENAIEINVASLANGIYLMMIYDANNILIRTDKLVKN